MGRPLFAETVAHTSGACHAPRPYASMVLSAHCFSVGSLSASGILETRDTSGEPPHSHPSFTPADEGEPRLREAQGHAGQVIGMAGCMNQSASAVWPWAATNFLGPQFPYLYIRLGYPWHPRLLGEDLSVYEATLSSPQDLAAPSEILSKRLLFSLRIPTTSLFPPLPRGSFLFASCPN